MTTFGLVEAVITGLVLSMALFIAAMNRSLVRSVSTGLSRASRRVYATVPASVLRAEGHRLRVVEVDGAIFFGTADRLAAEVLRNTEGASYLILDLRRVTMIDASGALMLERVAQTLKQRNVALLLAHITATSSLGRALHGAGTFVQRHHADWFPDCDRALEWADHLEDIRREMRLPEFALFAELTQAQLDRVKPYLDRQHFAAHATLFREGDVVDRVFLLARGAVSVMAVDPGDAGRQRRVLTLAPGVMFGEGAMLAQGQAMSTAVAEEDTVTYTLSRGSLQEIRSIDRDLHEQLLRNMLGHVAGLLRATTGVLRESTEVAE
jgi:CRP-like cAMP-binding protein